MSLAVLASRALHGMEGLPVRVEVHLGNGLPAFNMVGLAGADVRESRDRVRSAIITSGFEFPAGRITVNLAPADTPKESGRFDLPIALGILLASGQLDVSPDGIAARLDKYVFAGELSLTGAVMPVRAPLAIALAVMRHDPGAVLVLPPACARVAAQVPGLQVLAVDSLAALAGHFSGKAPLPEATPEDGMLAGPGADDEGFPCLSDVRGQLLARRALEIAAAGGHSLLMAGPPGAGKSMLAQRLPGILPRLTQAQALEASAIHGMAGGPAGYSDRPAFRAPHHSASAAALVGGGRHPRPGEISLAHHGVLFLDELPEFGAHVLESLREPLETGQITIARASGVLTFPARFQFVAAMNPCPCGLLGHPAATCRCSTDAIIKYRGRISGPILDRIDLQVILPATDAQWLDAPPGEPSGPVRERVARCRVRQLGRQGCTNAAMVQAVLDHHCRLHSEARALLRRGMARWRWSSRAVHRMLRVARTIADLDDSCGQPCTEVSASHLAEAIRLRQPWTT